MKRKLIIPALCLVLLFQTACGGGWPTLLRTALVASPAFIGSLNLGEKRQAVINDFAEIGGGVADFADDLKACAKAKPCSLEAVNKFQTKFWDVLKRGNFKLSPKLERIQSILQGILDSAKIFFGQRHSVARGSAPRVVSEQDLQAQIKELKLAMQP